MTPTPTPSTAPEAPEAPELKPLPCPFCGSEAIGGGRYVACGNAQCQMSLRPLMAETWNTRPSPPAAGWLQAASEEIAELSQKGVLTPQAVKQLLNCHAPDSAKLEAEDAEQWAKVAMQKQKEASAVKAENERLRKALEKIKLSWERAIAGAATDIYEITGWTGSLDNKAAIFAWVAANALEGK